MQILGVDFSGAKSDQNTWLAQGRLKGDTLTLEGCRAVSRARLTELLAGLSGPAVAALDFPFAVPQGFATEWQPGAATMPDLWRAAAAMDYADFLARRDGYVARHGEPKRMADTRFPECYSCLHKANPNMVPMTFRGMQMLHQLWDAGCRVPPLLPPLGARDVTLLEVMPGAVLRALGLPYKGYKKGKQASEKRQLVLENLAGCSGVTISGLARFQDLCLSSDDCLDAVVAAVAAVLWARDPSLFWQPPSPESDGYTPVVMLEGWLYAPVFLRDHA